MLRFLIPLIITLVGLCCRSVAQGIDSDSLATGSETMDYEMEQKHIKRATLYSAILPGAGQIKNKKHWKVPIIYGIAAGLIFTASNSNTNYLFFRENFLAEVDTSQSTINNTPFNASQLERRVDFFRRNRDFSYILLTVLYLLNMVDAHVDAHLRGFNIHENITLSFYTPPDRNTHSSLVGLSVALSFFD